MTSVLGTQMYPWLQDSHRRGLEFTSRLDDVLAEVAAAGFTAFEHSLSRESDVLGIAPLLAKRGLAMPAVYFGGPLHDERSEATIATIVKLLALAAEKTGTRIVNVNPDPLDWSSPLDKTDAQLRHQARALGALSARLAPFGVRLAYHTHNAEMRASAREFHFMLTANDPAHVGLCLDAHWIYRGADDSQAALESILSLHGARILSAHVRQSRGGVWDEVFGEGDVDYGPVVATLRRHGFTGPISLEQAIESGTPHTMPMAEAQRRGAVYARQLFSGILAG